MTPAGRLAEAAAVRPHPRQLAWQRLEFYGFIHFGINTMTGREWGLGHEDPGLFDPAELDAGQWVESLKAAGMRGLILTAKHHDGFCLWPSLVTRHSVAASPWRDGEGDLVREVAAACAVRDMKLGLYLSPWDRTEASYGSGKDYDDFFCAQLRELLTGYGPLFSVWFDGANGEGPNGRKQLYDWERYYALVRELQPDAVISVCGPDVRWCGNEAGHTRADEWSVVSASLRNAERVASRSQTADDGLFSRQVRSDEDDLGSRAVVLGSADPLVWYPAEVNTSIRPGWFYHQEEDGAVRSADELFAIYKRSVGGNATFLLNVPPDRRGLIAVPDVAVLRELGQRIAALRQRDVAGLAEVSVSSGGLEARPDGYGWRPDRSDARPVLRLGWDEAQRIEGMVLGEAIAEGQLIEGIEIAVRETTDGPLRVVATAGSVGYRRILEFEAVAAVEVVVTITAMRGPVRVSEMRVLGVGSE